VETPEELTGTILHIGIPMAAVKEDTYTAAPKELKKVPLPRPKTLQK
jgi:hypothetical protein